MHQFDLKNKTAIITGGAQGFGLEIAKKFLQSGSKVFIWDIDEKELLKVFRSIFRDLGFLHLLINQCSL